MAASSKRAKRKSTRATGPKTAARSSRKAGRPPLPILDLRRTPVQARGQKTFDRILDTTADLLEEVGVDVLTTNLIAKSADVNVATLYQYFPNKQAVLLALFERQSAARVEISERFIGGLGSAPDWRKHLRNLVQGVARGRSGTKGVAPLRQAMRSSPDLQAHDREHSQLLSKTLANELGRAGLRAEKATVVARTAIEALAALLDLWTIEYGGKNAKALEQLEAVLAGYLGPYLEKRRGLK